MVRCNVIARVPSGGLSITKGRAFVRANDANLTRLASVEIAPEVSALCGSFSI